MPSKAALRSKAPLAPWRARAVAELAGLDVAVISSTAASLLRALGRPIDRFNDNHVINYGMDGISVRFDRSGQLTDRPVGRSIVECLVAYPS